MPDTGRSSMPALRQYATHAVTLRFELLRASKGDGVSHRHPSRLAEDGSHLRMTIPPLFSLSKLNAHR